MPRLDSKTPSHLSNLMRRISSGIDLHLPEILSYALLLLTALLSILSQKYG